MEAVTFSRRLYGTPGTLIFLALSVGFGIIVFQHVEMMGSLQGTLGMLVGMAGYVLIGTVGWRYCLRRNSLTWVRVYFVVQVVLFSGMFWLENADTRNGAGVGNLLIPLLLQISVLGWWSRGALHIITILIMVIISAVFLPDGRIDGRVIGQAIILFFTNGSVVIIGYLIVSEERAREMLNQTNHKLTEYAEQIEELATVKERNRLAREIHDNLGHYLTAVNMQIEAALAVMESDQPRAVESLTKAQTLTKEGLSEIRRSIAALRAAPIENRPLHEAITLLVDENRAAGLDIHYSVEGQIRACSAQVEMALYRIAQEGLTNVRKHARTTRADLQLSYHNPQSVGLKVQDNGAGANTTNSGFGLLGIQERVKLLGGTLKIDTAQGFSLQVEIPV